MDENHALTEQVIGLAMKVHRALGPGFLESVYLNALLYELRQAGTAVEAGQRIKVRYRNVIVGDFIADLVIAGSLICEVKAISCLTKADEVQLVNYLTATNRRRAAPKFREHEPAVQTQISPTRIDARVSRSAFQSSQSC